MSAAKEALRNMYEAARCAVGRCSKNPEGLFPCNCECEDREVVDKALTVLLETYREGLEKIERDDTDR